MNSSEISPSLSKVEAIENFPVSDTMRNLKQILGMINFYRRFLPKCGQEVKPLTDMLTDVKICEIVLSDLALTAFRKNKKILSQAVKFLHVVPGNQLCLAVVASSIGVGAVLQQKMGDQWRPI